MGKKIAPEPVIASWEGADLALRQIGEIEIEVEKKEGLANLKINDIKEKLAGELNGKLARKARLAKDLEEFLGGHKEELGTAKSRKLNFGWLGFRLSPPRLKPIAKMTWAKVAEKLKELGLKKYLRFPDPEPDKEKIKAEADFETMKEIGVRICSEENFYYEVDREKIAETG